MLARKAVDQFFNDIEPIIAAFRFPSVKYIAIRHNEEFELIQGRLVFNILPEINKAPAVFESKNVRAGQFYLSDLGLDARQVIESLLVGKLPTPHGNVNFPQIDQDGPRALFAPFHEAGNQNRLAVLTLLGMGKLDAFQVAKQYLDWELRAAATPYDTLQDLVAEYQLNEMREDSVSFEAIAFSVAAVDSKSSINGGTANLCMRLADGLETERATLGYIVLNPPAAVVRSILKGSEMNWQLVDGVLQGAKTIEIPSGSVLHCFASYDGLAQHHWWLHDPFNQPNLRRAIYEVFDPGLDILREYLTCNDWKKRNARELEVAVSWLLWMLGFSVVNIGGTPKTTDAVDLIVTTPAGHYAVVECTTGILRADSKLSHLIERTAKVRERLSNTNADHLRVLPIIVTTMTESQVHADIEQAEKLGVLVLTRENLEKSLNDTLFANADRIYQQAQDHVQAAQMKYQPIGM